MKSQDENAEQLTDEQQRFVGQHTPLIYHTIRKHNYHTLPEETYEDLVTRLFYRLCVCARNYDATRKIKPSSYLVNCFEGEIKNYFRDEIWMIRPPRELREGSFSTAVDETEDGKSKAEQRGENPEAVRTSANPLPLDALYSDEAGEDEFYLDIVASEDNVEATVMAGLGGGQILALIYQALQPEEQVILRIMTEEGALVRVQETYHISHETASEVWVELKERVAGYWQIANAGGFPEPSIGNETLLRVLRQRFVPQLEGFVSIRRRVTAQQRAALAA